MENREMDNREDLVQSVSDSEKDETELSEQELDEASGGIIVIGGKPAYGFQSKVNWGALNPQPLPPKIQGNPGAQL